MSNLCIIYISKENSHNQISVMLINRVNILITNTINFVAAIILIIIRNHGINE